MAIMDSSQTPHDINVGHKGRVYLNEFNVLMDRTVYLPLVSGLLQAHAQQNPAIAAAYEFMPYLFGRKEPGEIVGQYQNPHIAAFSVFMWNEQLCLNVAKEIKQLFPECLIVFGGQQVPHDATEYLSQHTFIDIAVNGEGEETFRDILQQFLVSRDFSEVSGITWRNGVTGKIILNDDRNQIAHLNQIPSPYLEGLFDRLIAEHPDLTFQAIIQSNRGCPFSCAYCSWHKNWTGAAKTASNTSSAQTQTSASTKGILRLRNIWWKQRNGLAAQRNSGHALPKMPMNEFSSFPCSFSTTGSKKG